MESGHFEGENRFNFRIPPPAEGLNFHIKQSKIQSHDYKFKIIAVKVNHL